jgi:malate dehydrogenase (oxaloacetate-decarboxylating)
MMQSNTLPLKEQCVIMSEEEDSKKLGELSLKYASSFKGKIHTLPKVPITKLSDFAIWYTPGIARVSKEIEKDKDTVFTLTGRWNTIAILTDGSRVLGLGNIGPLASTPVMEGKALIFKYLGGVDAIPLPVVAHTKDDLVNIGKAIEPAFGGINLEDIESPKCFEVLKDLSNNLNIPVWHDDQLGTASASLAAFINATRLTGRKINETKVVLFGAGAANLATAKMFIKAGVNAKYMIIIDSKGILNAEREDMDHIMLTNPEKYKLALETNKEHCTGDINNCIDGADVLISASKPVPGLIKKKDIQKMNKEAIVFALANPLPEIWPKDAKEAGAKIVGTGRSDFPNQINNSLIFPAVFRGALDARSRKINMEMAIEAAFALADSIKDKINVDYIIPNMTDHEVFPMIAARVAMKSVEMGMARRTATYNQFYDEAKSIIEDSRKEFNLLLSNHLIKGLNE